MAVYEHRTTPYSFSCADLIDIVLLHVNFRSLLYIRAPISIVISYTYVQSECTVDGVNLTWYINAERAELL